MSAIMVAIESPEVSRLILTRKCLEEKEFKHDLGSMSKLIDPKHSHMAYKDALPDPKDTNSQCVPILGELYFISIMELYRILT